jgi:hypothetical protein
MHTDTQALGLTKPADFLAVYSFSGTGALAGKIFLCCRSLFTGDLERTPTDIALGRL